MINWNAKKAPQPKAANKMLFNKEKFSPYNFAHISIYYKCLFIGLNVEVNDLANKSSK